MSGGCPAGTGNQIDVHLARAQHDTTDIGGPCLRVLVVDRALEAPFCQFARRRGHKRMAQQALRREHDQRQGIDQQQRGLPPQQVEILRGRRAVDHSHVDVGGELKEALRPGARMLGPRALVRVGQQQHHRGTLPPFAARRQQELVEDHLRAVDEVAVLRFPDDEPRRLLDVVADSNPIVASSVSGELWISKAAFACGMDCSGVNVAPVFGSWRTAWRWLKVPRCTSSPVRRMLTPSPRIDAYASSSAAAQSTVRSPGCANICARRSRPRTSFLCTREAIGQLQQTALSVDRASSGTEVFAFRLRPTAAPAGSARRNPTSGLSAVEHPLQLVQVIAVHVRRLGVGDDAARRRGSGADLTDGRVRGDLLVHERLGERRLVAFVVAVAAVADQIDQEIALERRAVRDGETGRLDARFRIVGVDMDDRDLESTGEPARVQRAVGLARHRREPELIVHDDVNRAASRVARQPSRFSVSATIPWPGNAESP